MGLHDVYTDIASKLSKLDFGKIWPGFHPLKFALYDDENCFFDGEYIEKTDDFCANTTIAYNQENIAIWRVTGEENLDILTCNIVHEMFHAYQVNQGWDCWANETEALQNYQYISENLSGKLYENELIVALGDAFDSKKYKELLDVRAYRCARFPYEYQYEAKIEEIEGTANYVEWMALRQLDEAKAHSRFEKMKTAITDPSAFFPIRKSCDYTGALMIVVSLLAGDYSYDSTDRPHAVRIVQTMDAAAAGFDASRLSNSKVEQEVASYHQETKRMIEKAVQHNHVLLTGPLELVSVNIYDARCQGEYITSRYFLMYLEHDEQKVKNGNFIIKMSGPKTIDLVYQWD